MKNKKENIYIETIDNLNKQIFELEKNINISKQNKNLFIELYDKLGGLKKSVYLKYKPENIVNEGFGDIFLLLVNEYIKENEINNKKYNLGDNIELYNGEIITKSITEDKYTYKNKDLIKKISELLLFLNENRNLKVEIITETYNHYDNNGNIQSIITERNINLISEDNKENVFKFDFNFINQ